MVFESENAIVDVPCNNNTDCTCRGRGGIMGMFSVSTYCDHKNESMLSLLHSDDAKLNKQ